MMTCPSKPHDIEYERGLSYRASTQGWLLAKSFLALENMGCVKTVWNFRACAH